MTDVAMNKADTPVTLDVDGGQARPPVSGGQISLAVLLVLALLQAVAPLATDLYLPAFPTMADELHTSATSIQFTLTALLLGMTFGQLIFGPLSDRYGRKIPLLVGAALCVVASVAAVWAPTIAVLVVARLLQGIGGAAGMVIGRAIIADLATGKVAAKAFNLMMIVGGVAPVVGPVVGGFLVDSIGWRGVLGIILVLAVLMLVTSAFVLRETNPAQRRTPADTGGRSRYAALGNPQFLLYTAVFAFSFAVMMAYISASPFLYQDMMGLSSTAYGCAFGANALALMAASGMSAKLADRLPTRTVLTIGISIMATSTAVFALLVFVDVPVMWLAVPLFVLVGSLGFILGNATALALGSVPASAGGASAVLGASQFGLAACASPLVSLAGEDTAVPMAIVMVVCAAIAVGAFLAVGRRGSRVG